MKIANKLFSVVMAMLMVCVMALPAFATDLTTAGGSADTPVTLTTEATTFKVTVPTALPISVDADGVVTTAEDAYIVNQSYGAVKVTNLEIAEANDYIIVAYSTDMSQESVGSKKIGMQIHNETTSRTGNTPSISFTQSNWASIAGKIDQTSGGSDNADGSNKLNIDYDAVVAATTTAVTDQQVATVTFTIGWDS